MLSYEMQMSDSGWGSTGFVINSTPAPIGSGYYPARQYDTIRSESVAPAGGSGTTYRWTYPENKSMAETGFWSKLGWVGSPYEDDKAIPVKVAESKQVAATVEPQKDELGEGLDWALDTSIKAATLYEQVMGIFKPRETIRETPREGYPEGRDVQNTNTVQSRSADVISTGQQLYNQVKGLFSLGYEQKETQRVPRVQQELSPSQLPFGLTPMMIAIGLGLFLLGKK